MSEAIIGIGMLVEMSTPAAPTVWVEIEEAFDASPPNDTEDQIDVTHYQSPNRRREFIAGLTDGGEVAISLNHVPGSATDLFLIAAKGESRNIRITYFSGVQVEFLGARRGYEISSPVDDKMTAVATFKVSGDVTQSAAGIPVNSVKPSIAGIPQQGVVLTAHPGVWSPGGTFTYQWENDGTPIGGATSRTYTPVAGDIGDTLTVVVTCTNSEGNASAESAGAIDVVGP